MLIEVDREGLMNLLRGTWPSLKAVSEDYILKECGYYSDLTGWHWHPQELEKRTDEQLYGLYKLCRLSTEKQ